MLLTVNDLARMFRRSHRTIHRWRQKGIIPPTDRKVAGSPFWEADTIAIIGKPSPDSSSDSQESLIA